MSGSGSEKHYIRNNIEELWVVELSEEFWHNHKLWPDWFAEKTSTMADDRYSSKPSESDYDHGFMIVTSSLQELSESQKYMYEYDDWKPTLFYGYNRYGMWNLVEGEYVGYSPSRDMLVFGDRLMFDTFFDEENGV